MGWQGSGRWGEGRGEWECIAAGRVSGAGVVEFLSAGGVEVGPWEGVLVGKGEGDEGKERERGRHERVGGFRGNRHADTHSSKPPAELSCSLVI